MRVFHPKRRRPICLRGGAPLKLLYLHGWHAGPGGTKATFLAETGFEVIAPALSDESFSEALTAAQDARDKHRPDIIVGSSRGGAVAVNLNSGETPQLLLCPAWKHWGEAGSVKRRTIILHGTRDETIPIEHSEELIAVSGLEENQLIRVDDDHRLGLSLGEMLLGIARLRGE
jgi:hypothetical protein